MSSIICDHWWYLKTEVLKCHRGYIKIKDDIVYCSREPYIGLGQAGYDNLRADLALSEDAWMLALVT